MVTVATSVYFFIYLIFCSFLFLGDTRQFHSISKRSLLVLAMCLIMILFSGLRWETGTDWKNYKVFFESISFQNIMSREFYHFDPGYRILNCLVNTFTDSYTVFLIVDTWIAVFLVWYTIKKTGADMIWSLLVLYANHFIAFYMGANRMILAVGAALAGTVFIFKKQTKKAVFCEAAACLMHKASVVCCLNFFIPKKIIKKSRLLILFTLSALTGVFGLAGKILRIVFEGILSITYSHAAATGLFYLTETAEETGLRHFLAGSVKRAAVLCFLYYFYQRKSTQKSQVFEYYFNIFFVSVCIYLATNSLGVFRTLSAYLAVCEIIVWGSLVQIAGKRDRVFVKCCIVCLFAIETLNSFPRYLDAYIPYRSVFGA